MDINLNNTAGLVMDWTKNVNGVTGKLLNDALPPGAFVYHVNIKTASLLNSSVEIFPMGSGILHKFYIPDGLLEARTGKHVVDEHKDRGAHVQKFANNSMVKIVGLTGARNADLEGRTGISLSVV